MNRILKIVGGPLRGAEIALVAGTTVKVGSGEGCDILVSDPTIGDVAFELEVTEEDVTITLPDGTAKTMLDFEAREIGSSAFAVGPAEGVWQEIVWPENSGQEAGDGDRKEAEKAAAEAADEVPPKANPAKEEGAEDERPEAEDEKRPSRLLLFVLSAVLLVIVLVIFLLSLRSCCGNRCACEESVAAGPSLAEIAARYGLTLVETNGETVVYGNFRTRVERLRATAETYAARPGVELDVADDESLAAAATDLLRLVTEGRIKVAALTNRVVVLKGNAASADALHDILVALNEDVPGLVRADCRQVVCGSGKSEEEYAPDVPALPGVTRPPRKMKRSSVSPNLPICGILTQPYPCLILKNGMRIVEGGEFGGCIVERIAADAVTLRNNSGTFEWRP